jgi:adenylate cyclase
MQLSSTLSWLVDVAGEVPGADRLLAELGTHLVGDGLPLAGAALTLAVPHPLIARRTWLWRAENGEVIEALGFAAGGPMAALEASPASDAGRMGLRSAGSGRVRSRRTRPMNCDRPRALPRHRLHFSPRAPH